MTRYCIDSYRKDHNAEDDPFISPLYMNEKILERLPPVRIFVGSSDPFRDDCFLFLKRLKYII